MAGIATYTQLGALDLLDIVESTVHRSGEPLTMIVGYNVDIEHNGKTFHIQTEDKGRDDAVIETLVYIAGKILHSERTSYKDIASACKDEDIARLMEMQHKRVTQTIRSGRFDEGPKQSFGEELFSSRSFDQVVLDFLEEDSEDFLELALKGEAPLRPGQMGKLKVLARTSLTKNPVPNAELIVHLVNKDDEGPEIARAVSGEDGTADITLEIPKEVGKGSSVLVRATSDAGQDQIRQYIVV